MVKNNILIIGGSGFIGYHLAKRCLIKGWKVYSISSKPPSKKKYFHRTKPIYYVSQEFACIPRIIHFVDEQTADRKEKKVAAKCKSNVI